MQHSTKATLKAGLFWMAVGTPVLASAVEFTLPFGEEGIKAVLNNTITAGAQWRMQERSADLVGKGNLDPAVCGRQGQGNVPIFAQGGQDFPYYQSCQGLFRTQSFPAERLTQVPGQFGLNNDDGNLNYDKHDITQAPIKLTQDLTLSFPKDIGFFARSIYFYDPVNANLREYHPNMLTRDNFLQSGTPVEASNNNGLARDDSIPCGARDRDGNPATGCGIVFGAGQVVRNRRDNTENRRQIASNFQLLDFVGFGKVPLPGERELTVKLGRQTVNWGESTLLVINSLNQAQPVNANNFTRVGFQVEEVFTPQASLFLSTEPFTNATIEAYYQFQWEPVEIPAYGSFFSFVDAGTNNSGPEYIISSFGGAAEDRDGVGFLLDNSLSGLTNTSLRVPRLRDNEPDRWGMTNQYGLSFKYYAENLNNGTQLGAYYMNYHSKLPYLSAFAATPDCGRNARTTQQFLQDCPDIPLLHNPKNDPAGATSDPILFDTARIQLEYPENIQLYGLSFNTTVGDISLQGEVAFRPQMPLQVDPQDILFMAYGPTLTRCHKATLDTNDPTRNGPCNGTGNGPISIPGLPVGLPVGGIGTDPNTGGTMVYGSSDWVIDANETKGPFNDTFDLLVGHGTGSARAFPSFLAAYRGFEVGENPNTDPNLPYNSLNPGYIRGYEKLPVYQFNLGMTQVLGATDNFLGADQIINLLEIGGTWVPDLPPLDILQFEAAGTDTHASAGADGTGADRSRQACSLNPTCSFGRDGLRFNPTQQDLSMFPDKFSWGYRIISLIRYESILPGFSMQPMVIWQHDMNGTAPAPLDVNFVEGRKTMTVNMEMRYKSALSFTPGYTWFTGAGKANLLRDRDYFQMFVKYQF